MAQGADRLELADPKAYVQSLIDRVGDRDPLEIFEETPGRVAEILAGHSEETLRSRPFEGKWSPLEILGHLVDTELVFGYRVRVVACDEHPKVIGIDQDLWVEGLRHADRDPEEVLEELRDLRAVNIGFWERLDEDRLDRVVQHDERGEESLRMMRSLIAGHDLYHLEQLERYVRAAAG